MSGFNSSSGKNLDTLLQLPSPDDLESPAFSDTESEISEGSDNDIFENLKIERTAHILGSQTTESTSFSDSPLDNSPSPTSFNTLHNTSDLKEDRSKTSVYDETNLSEKSSQSSHYRQLSTSSTATAQKSRSPTTESDTFGKSAFPLFPSEGDSPGNTDSFPRFKFFGQTSCELPPKQDTSNDTAPQKHQGPATPIVLNLQYNPVEPTCDATGPKTPLSMSTLPAKQIQTDATPSGQQTTPSQSTPQSQGNDGKRPRRIISKASLEAFGAKYEALKTSPNSRKISGLIVGSKVFPRSSPDRASRSHTTPSPNKFTAGIATEKHETSQADKSPSILFKRAPVSPSISELSHNPLNSFKSGFSPINSTTFSNDEHKSFFHRSTVPLRPQFNKEISSKTVTEKPEMSTLFPFLVPREAFRPHFGGNSDHSIKIENATAILESNSSKNENQENQENLTENSIDTDSSPKPSDNQLSSEDLQYPQYLNGSKPSLSVPGNSLLKQSETPSELPDVQLEGTALHQSSTKSAENSFAFLRESFGSQFRIAKGATETENTATIFEDRISKDNGQFLDNSLSTSPDSPVEQSTFFSDSSFQDHSLRQPLKNGNTASPELDSNVKDSSEDTLFSSDSKPKTFTQSSNTPNELFHIEGKESMALKSSSATVPLYFPLPKQTFRPQFDNSLEKSNKTEKLRGIPKRRTPHGEDLNDMSGNDNADLPPKKTSAYFSQSLSERHSPPHNTIPSTSEKGSPQRSFFSSIKKPSSFSFSLLQETVQPPFETSLNKPKGMEKRAFSSGSEEVQGQADEGSNNDVTDPPPKISSVSQNRPSFESHSSQQVLTQKPQSNGFSSFSKINLRGTRPSNDTIQQTSPFAGSYTTPKIAQREDVKVHAKENFASSKIQNQEEQIDDDDFDPQEYIAEDEDTEPFRLNQVDSYEVRFYNDPNIPYTLSLYLQIFINIVMACIFFYFLFSFASTIHSDVDKRVTVHSAELLAEIAECSRQYLRNNCMPGRRVPVLESMCSSWEKCMNRDPSIVGRAQVSAETFSQIIDGFVKHLSIRTWTIFFGAFVVAFVLPNFAFSSFRSNRLSAPQPSRERKAQKATARASVTQTPSRPVFGEQSSIPLHRGEKKIFL